MYSQPWSPTPSTTATAPELRTQNRSPTLPRRNTSPLVAPYAITLPPAMFCSAANTAAAVRPDDDPAAGQALRDVVVGVAEEAQRDACGQEGAERLARADPVSVMSIVPSARPSGCSLVTSLPSIVPTVRLTLRTGSAMRTGSRRSSASWLSSIRLEVQGLLQAVVLLGRVVPRAAGRAFDDLEDRREVEARTPSSGRRPRRVSRPRPGRSPPRRCGSRARPGARAPPRRCTRRTSRRTPACPRTVAAARDSGSRCRPDRCRGDRPAS